MPSFRYVSGQREGTTQVYYRGKFLGTLISTKERNGRCCFKLDSDQGSEGRSYRGRDVAASALLAMVSLVEAAHKRKWTPAQLVLRAWSKRPNTADHSE
jgi:hypothetical protein